MANLTGTSFVVSPEAFFPLWNSTTSMKRAYFPTVLLNANPTWVSERPWLSNGCTPLVGGTRRVDTSWTCLLSRGKTASHGGTIPAGLTHIPNLSPSQVKPHCWSHLCCHWPSFFLSLERLEENSLMSIYVFLHLFNELLFNNNYLLNVFIHHPIFYLKPGLWDWFSSHFTD